MLTTEMEIPSAETVIEIITQQVLATVSTEPIIDRDIIKESVIRALEELGLIEVI